MKRLLICITIIYLCASCSNYYKAIIVPVPLTTDPIADLKMKNKYFILRDNDRAFAMNNISFTPDRKIMQCNLETLPGEHMLHVTKGRKGKMKYVNSGDQDESAVLNEVHIYTSPGLNTVAGSYTTGLDKIQKIEVLEKDKQRTRKSKTRGTIITIAGSVVAAALITLILIASSLKSLHI